LHVGSSSILVREDTNHAICWLQLAWHAAQHATRWVRTAGTATAECFTSLTCIHCWHANCPEMHMLFGVSVCTGS
jgi:hypothetical protein